MSVKPECHLYDYHRLISENSLTQSWDAIRLDTGNRCFIKTPSDVGELSLGQKAEILRRSFKAQSRIRSSSIVSARSLKTEKQNVIVEYPNLDQAALSEVSLHSLCEDANSGLRQLAIIVDYLHLLGLVHLDLKLENFQFLSSSKGSRVVLLDLDNLIDSGSEAGHLVVGTPGNIAPEIIKNDCISTKSDLYSLGCSLASALEDYRARDNGNTIGGTSAEKLKSLSSVLAEEAPSDRPELLIDAMRSIGLLDSNQYQLSLKTLTAMSLLTRFKALRQSKGYSNISLETDILHYCNLYSLPEELTRDLQRELTRSPTNALKTIKKLLRNSEVILFGEFWHLEISDKELLRAFLSLESHPEKPGLSLAEDTGRSSAPEPASSPVGVHPAQGLKWYLVETQHLNTLDSNELEGFSPQELAQLASAATAIGRPTDAAALLQQALRVASPDSDEFLELLFRCAQQQLAAGDIDNAAESLDKGTAASEQAGAKVWELEFRRLKAWLASYEGDHESAIRSLDEIISEARKEEPTDILAKALGDLAGVLRRNGQYEKSRTHFEESIDLAASSGIESEIVVVYFSYSLYCSQFGEYQKAISLAKSAAKFMDPTKQSQILPFSYLAIASGHTRRAEYRKADYWFGRCLTALHRQPDHLSYATYFSTHGWSYSIRGKLDEARRALGLALKISSEEGGRYESALCLRNFAELALYEGDRNKCERYIVGAQEALAQRPDDTVAAELDLLVLMNDFFNGKKSNFDACLDSCQRLLSRNCVYYAAWALLVTIIEGESDWLQSRKKLIEQLSRIIPSDETPVFVAVSCLVQSIAEEDASLDSQITVAKHAYKVLESAGQVFLAMRLCASVARLYFRGLLPRLGCKFLVQARELASQLSNREMCDSFDELLEENSVAKYEKTSVLRSFDGIADVLSSLEQQQDPLKQVLQFAVSTVEAERGVLLLRNLESDNLRVKAYINCENASLKDILDYSQNIPKTAFLSAHPVYVRDALVDGTTRNFKSIVAHNIRSVICVPIVTEGTVEGVIYLDHQTIPALFDDSDLVFVQSLAKFVSVMLGVVVRHDSAKQHASYLENGLAELGVDSEFVTRNPGAQAVIAQIRQLADSNISVLVSGESGVGKEILCRRLHSLSARRDAPFVKMNCAAMPESLVESELFGVADGTATGVKGRLGKFEVADGGSLFLDEIGDMPLSLQSKVLRVLEEQEFERVGAVKTIYTDIRFVYATNRDLKEMVRAGTFREDLYYRVCGIEVRIPPLRERPDDVSVLLEHFCNVFGAGRRKRIRLSTDAMRVLESYSWPGNVRELRNIVERLSVLSPGKLVRVTDLPGEIVREAGSGTLSESVARRLEEARIRSALENNGWNQSASARELSMSLASLRRRVKKYSIRRI